VVGTVYGAHLAVAGLQQASDPRLAALEAALSSRGFAVQRIPDMDGWLAYHAAFIACVAAEMRGLGQDVAARITGSPALAELLGR
jgi:hypothetical protein